VHAWPLAELHRTGDWFPSYRTVGQFMSTELFTVRPGDPVELAARLMDWQQVRHLPVEDDHGKLVGLLSFRALLPLVARGCDPTRQQLTVQDIMQPEPHRVTVDTPTLEALTIMREHNIGSLPVVDSEQRLIGLVTVYELFEIAAKVLEDFLRGDAGDPASARPSTRGVPKG
jgi:CBS domain-containing protein